MNNPRRKKTVIIADDNKDVREVLRTQLQMLGYRVLEAADGQEAVELVQSEVPNLILMDLSMPRVDGFEATRRIRQNTPKSEVIIIALTCLGGLQVKQRAIAAGCDDYALKPIGLAELSLLLARHRVPKERKIA